MGTQTYAHIINAIRKQYPNKTDAELLQMMMKFRQWKRSKFSEETMIRIVNHKFHEQGRRLIGAPKNNAIEPDDGVKWKDGQYIPGYIEPFTPEQRKERKAKSEVVFRALFGQANLAARGPQERAEAALGKDFSGIEREDYVLLRDPAVSNSPEELKRINDYNQNIVELFGKDPKRKEALIAKGMSSEEAEQTIRDNRATVVMGYFDGLGQVEDNLEEMIRTDLPDDQLEKNVKRICELSNAIATIDNFLSKIPKSLTLPVEYLEKLRKLSDRQNEVAAALHRAYAMSSPIFEYLDSDWLMGDPFQAYFEDVYDENMVRVPEESLVEYTAAPEEEQEVLSKEEEQLFTSMTGSMFDPADGFIRDAFNRAEHHTNQSMYEALHSFGFTNLNDNEQTQFSEEQLPSGLYSMKADHGPALMLPVFAMERNNRYGVFQKAADGNYKAVDPGALFNHSLKTMTDSLTADLNIADPAGHRGSRQFREMRKEFEKITNHFEEFELGNYNSSLNTQRAVLYSLIDKANAYIATKDASLEYVADRRANAKKHNRTYNLTTRETWDEKRVAMANKLKNFAELKLQELALVEATRKTLNEYKTTRRTEPGMPDKEVNMTPAERMERIALLDAQYLQEARTNAPEQWIIDKIQNTYIGKAGQINNIPEAISSQLQRSAEAISITKLDTMIRTQEDTYLALVGRMVAAEQIMQEAPGGPLRSFYSDAENKDFVALGRNAMKNAKGDLGLGNEVLDEMLGGAFENELTRDDILAQADQFDPKQIAKNLMQAQKELAEQRKTQPIVKDNGNVINEAPENENEIKQDEAALNFVNEIFSEAKQTEPLNVINEAPEKDLPIIEIANVLHKLTREEPEEDPFAFREEAINAILDLGLEKKVEDLQPEEQKEPPIEKNNGNVINEAPENENEIKQDEAALNFVDEIFSEAQQAAERTELASSVKYLLDYKNAIYPKYVEEYQKLNAHLNKAEAPNKKAEELEALGLNEEQAKKIGILGGEAMDDFRAHMSMSEEEIAEKAKNGEKDLLDKTLGILCLTYFDQSMSDPGNTLEVPQTDKDMRAAAEEMSKLFGELDAVNDWKQKWDLTTSDGYQKLRILHTNLPEQMRFMSAVNEYAQYYKLFDKLKKEPAPSQKQPDVKQEEQRKTQPIVEDNSDVINEAPEEAKKNSLPFEEFFNGFARGSMKYRADVNDSNLAEPLKKEINDILKKFERHLYYKDVFDPDVLKSGCKLLKELLNRADPEDNKLKKFREYVDELDEALNGPKKKFEPEVDLNMDPEFDLGPMLNDVLNKELTEQDEIVLNGLVDNITSKQYRKFMRFCKDKATITTNKLEDIVKAKGEQASAANQDRKELTTLLKNVLAADGDERAGYTAMFHLANSAASAKTPAYKEFGKLLKRELERYALPNKSVFISEKYTKNFKDERKALQKEVYDARFEVNSKYNQENMKQIHMGRGMSRHNLHDYLGSCLKKQDTFLRNADLFPNRDNVTKWRELLNDTQKYLAVAESHGFFLPLVRTSLAAQTDYLDAAMGIAPWKDIPLKQAASEKKKPAKFTDTTPETAKFYEKSNWLLSLQVAEPNSVTEAIDNKLSELLAKNMNTRAYEVCNKKRDNVKNAVKGSDKMKNLAMYATMKALLLNEQCEPHLDGRKGQFTEMLSDLCAKKTLSAKELDKVLDKVLNPMFKENEEFTTAFNALDNRGMYNFIVNAEYKSLAPKVASGVYENIYKMRTAKQKDKTKSSHQPITEKKKSPVRPG